MWFCLAVITVICSACAIYVQVWDAIPIVFTLTMAVGLVVIDMQVRNIIVFLTARRLREMILETEKLAEQAHANEMRSMIANVAHDLKTVRSIASHTIFFVLLCNQRIFLLIAAIFLYNRRRFNSVKFQ
jgi:signal transduction histidine kinase